MNTHSTDQDVAVPALTETLSVRLDRESMQALSSIAAAEHRAPAAVVRDWIFERLGRTPAHQDVALEGAVDSGTTDPGEALRQRYRPDDIVVLFVGESAPAGGTFFYQADSNLFRATREACTLAFGNVPDGPAFLWWFRDKGFWLCDLADRPVNRNRGRPRKLEVNAGVAGLAAVIADAQPDFVVSVKTSIETEVRQAAERAGFAGNRIVVLPFPLYQWRDVYVRELARFFGWERTTSPGRRARQKSSTSDGTHLTLHEAMEAVLRTRDGGPVPARELANEIAARDFYARQDGGRADHQQILARARKYPHLFAVERSGVQLR